MLRYAGRVIWSIVEAGMGERMKEPEDEEGV
jgi:hypothetical protein